MDNKQIGMFKLGTGLLLFIISIILSIILTPIGILYGIFKSFKGRQFLNGIKNVDDKLYNLACIIDLLGNITCFE
jgi:hypothetical protein